VKAKQRTGDRQATDKAETKENSAFYYRQETTWSGAWCIFTGGQPMIEVFRCTRGTAVASASIAQLTEEMLSVSSVSCRVPTENWTPV